MNLSFRQYSSYVVVAGVAFVATVVSRELFQLMFPTDTVFYYVLSMLLAYGFGILVNFSLQHAITFSSGRVDKGWRMFTGFMLVALAGAVITALVSVTLRYLIELDVLLGRYGASVAFIGGNIVASLVTYWMNARFVFSHEPLSEPH